MSIPRILHTSHMSRIQSELAIRKNPIVHPTNISSFLNSSLNSLN
jgi:hypothetical protein